MGDVNFWLREVVWYLLWEDDTAYAKLRAIACLDRLIFDLKKME